MRSPGRLDPARAAGALALVLVLAVAGPLLAAGTPTVSAARTASATAAPISLATNVGPAAAVAPATPNPWGAIDTIGVGGLPQFAAYDPFNHWIYVPNWANSNVSVLNGTDVTATVTAGSIPFSATYDPANHFVYIVNEGSNNVTIINGTHVQANVRVGTTPQFASYDSANQWIYVSNSGSANVTAINGTAVVATIPVGTDPSRVVVAVTGGGGGGGGGWVPAGQLAPSAGGPNLYVPNSGSNNVTVISGTDGKTIAGNVHVGSDPQFATWDPNNVWLYVPNNQSGNVSVLNSVSPFNVLYTIAVGTNPWSASFDPTTGQVLVVNFGSNSLTVLGGTLATTVVATIPVGTGPEFVTQDAAAGGIIFVPNTGSNTVSVVFGSSVLGTIPAGNAPIFGTLDPANGYVYIQNFASSNVTVLAQSHSVTFKAVGLPAGSPWSVRLGSPPNVRNNTTLGAVGKVQYFEPTGHLNFTFTQPVGWGVERVTGPGLPSQTGGNTSGPTVFTVRFAPIVTLTFNETGLAAGLAWGVAITSPFPFGGGPGQNASGHGTSFNFTVVGGPWKFSVTQKPSTYLAAPHKGAVVAGAHAATHTFKTIKFRLISERVIFTETGLPAGHAWGVNITGPVNFSLNTTSGPIVVALPNGTYNYTLWNFTALHPHASHGSIVVVAPHTAVHVVTSYTSSPVAAVPGAALPLASVPQPAAVRTGSTSA